MLKLSHRCKLCKGVIFSQLYCFLFNNNETIAIWRVDARGSVNLVDPEHGG